MEVSCFPMQSSTVEQVRRGDARSCHDVTVAIATTQVILGQYQTFYAELVGNYMAILCAKLFLVHVADICKRRQLPVAVSSSKHNLLAVQRK